MSAEKDPELEELRKKLDAALDREPVRDHGSMARYLVAAVVAVLLGMLLLGATCGACTDYLSDHVHT